MTGSASGSGRRGWKERGMVGTGAYAANGGMLILELDDGAVGHGGRSGVRPGLWMVLCC